MLGSEPRGRFDETQTALVSLALMGGFSVCGGVEIALLQWVTPVILLLLRYKSFSVLDIGVPHPNIRLN